MGKQYGLRSGSGRAYLFLASLALAGLFTSTSAYGSTLVDVTTTLQNYTFGTSAVTGACPTDWTCSGGVQGGEYVPDSNEYNPATDLSGGGGLGAYAPQGNGTWVFEQPNKESSAEIFSANSTDVYTSGDEYYLDLWLGTPQVVYDNTTECSPAPFCPAAPIQSVVLYWLENGSPAGVPPIYLSVPTTGTWINDTAETDFTPGAGFGSYGDDISVEVYSVCGSDPCNNLVSDLQFAAAAPPPTIPEPGTFLLIGMGMVSLAYTFRRKSVRNS